MNHEGLEGTTRDPQGPLRYHEGSTMAFMSPRGIHGGLHGPTSTTSAMLNQHPAKSKFVKSCHMLSPTFVNFKIQQSCLGRKAPWGSQRYLSKNKTQKTAETTATAQIQQCAAHSQLSATYTSTDNPPSTGKCASTAVLCRLYCCDRRNIAFVCLKTADPPRIRNEGARAHVLYT